MHTCLYVSSSITINRDLVQVYTWAISCSNHLFYMYYMYNAGVNELLSHSGADLEGRS